MDTYNYFVTTYGDPILAAGVVILVGIFFFKEKKTGKAVGTLIGGATIYYVMHNLLQVLQLFGPIITRLFKFFSK